MTDQMHPQPIEKKVPAALCYKLPAEWEKHEATWLAWPYNKETWPGKFEKIPSVWVKIVKALHEHEKVNILVKNEEMKSDVKRILKQTQAWSSNVNLYQIPTNDAWIRDFGPIFIKNKNNSAITDWIFNVWGQRWEKERPLDDIVPTRIAATFGYELFEPEIVLEGGSIDVNGQGTLLTTESCLLSPTRNPHLNREQIEKYLHDYLGATNILWLKEGIVGDDTSGHIDDIARFVNKETIVCAVEENHAKENYEPSNRNFELLKTMKLENGKSPEVVKLPMPEPIPGPTEKGYENPWIPASYANFYIANGVLLVPVFNQPADRIAIETLASFFPDRTIVAIDCVDLVWGLGGIHCVTQQEPKC